MKVFELLRHHDFSGVSGTGIVAQGVEFDTGKVVLQWCSPGNPSSITIWDDMADVIEIHGHNGATEVVYL